MNRLLIVWSNKTTWKDYLSYEANHAKCKINYGRISRVKKNLLNLSSKIVAIEWTFTCHLISHLACPLNIFSLTSYLGMTYTYITLKKKLLHYPSSPHFSSRETMNYCLPGRKDVPVRTLVECYITVSENPSRSLFSLFFGRYVLFLASP